MNKTVSGLLVAALIGSGCSSNAPDQLAILEETSTTVEKVPTTVAGEDEELLVWTSPLDSFCADMRLAGSPDVEHDELLALYEDLIAGAPGEIAQETAKFIGADRQLSEILHTYRHDDEETEWEDVLAGLDPEPAAHLQELRSIASGSEFPNSSMGVVLRWEHRHCTGLERAWDTGLDAVTVEVRVVEVSGFSSSFWPISPSIETSIERVVKTVPNRPVDAPIRLCIDGNAFPILARHFGQARAKLFESDGKLWEVTIVPEDPFLDFEAISCKTD